MLKINYWVFALLVFCLACQTKKDNENKEVKDIVESVDPSKSSSSSSFVARKNYGAKYEAIAGVLHGAGQDPDGFADYVKAVGKESHPIIYMTYVNICNEGEISGWGPNLVEQLKNLPADIIPQIGLSFTGGKDVGAGLDMAVAEGKYDANLERFYKGLEAIDRPTFTRIGFEFDGSWNNYSPEGYKAVFKKITEEVRKRKLKTATVWCSAGGSAGFLSKEKLMEYYPGDALVDWWGVDIFSPDELKHPNLKQFYEMADAHKKPVMLGETTPRYVGVTDGEASWDKWFKPYFEGVDKNPGIKATCYINWDWKYWSDAIGFPWHDWGDARIEKNAIVLEKYKAEIGKKGYVHSK